jgi:hypothetical protein
MSSDVAVERPPYDESFSVLWYFLFPCYISRYAPERKLMVESPKITQGHRAVRARMESALKRV